MATVQVTRQSRLADDGKMIVHPIYGRIANLT